MLHSLKFMLLAPVVAALVLSFGAVYWMQNATTARIVQAQAAQQTDLQAIAQVAEFSHVLVDVHATLLRTMEDAQKHQTTLPTRRNIVNQLNALEPQLQQLMHAPLLQETAPMAALSAAFTQYHASALRASALTALQAQQAGPMSTQVNTHYLELFSAAAAVGEYVTGQAVERQRSRSGQFLASNQHLLWSSLGVLVMAFLLVHILVRRTHRDLLAITEGLEQLQQHPDAAPQLPAIEHLLLHRRGEIQTMAQALLHLSHAYERQRQAEEQAFTLSFYDPLTQLPNRRMLVERIRQLHSQHPQSAAALLILDIDNFKSFNDLQGHSAGDYALQETAKRLAHNAPSNSLTARVSGNAFAVLLWHLKEPETQALHIAEALAQDVRRPVSWLGREYLFSASMGITLFSGKLANLDEPLKNAEAAMYVAKGQGRGAIQFYDPTIQARLQEQLQLESDLRQALAHHELFVLYQAQADAQGQLVGAEALLRWQHPQRGVISPGVFIPLAENSDLIVSIGQWVLDTACDQLQQWAQHPATAGLTLAVNVSARQFQQDDFVGVVRQALQRTQIPPQRLKLELTESTVLDSVETTIAKMHELRTLGVRLSMDDFGTGYSSLQYLKRLPLDQLKIDQAFVRDITSNPADAAIVQTIVAMGHALGMQVIAEGVETQAQQQALLQHGCRFYQGYWFSRPVPMAELLALFPNTR